MDFTTILIAFIVIALIVTHLIKKFTKQQTFYIVSLIRTKKPLWLFDKFAKYHKFLDAFCEIGLLLGFGAIAADYLYGQKMKKKYRVVFFGISFLVISGLFFLVDWFLGNFISHSPLMKEQFLLIALVFGLSGFAGFTVLSLVFQGIDIILKLLVGKAACPGVAPLIPGVKIPKVPITIPLHAWISLLIILIIHEGMHGIVARREKISLKSSGILLLGFLPIGAFVEPEDEDVKKAEDKALLHLYAAGPTANLASLIVIQVFILVLALLLVAFVSPWAAPIHKQMVSGLEIASIDENIPFCGDVFKSPALGVLEKGMILKQVNDKNVSSLAAVQLIVAGNRFKPLKLGVIDKEKKFREITLEPNELGTYGFGLEETKNKDFKAPQLYLLYSAGFRFLNDFIGWLFILSLLVAIVNFLPLAVFDGGRLAVILLYPLFGFMKMNETDTKKLIGRLLFWSILALLIVNALPLFF